MLPYQVLVTLFTTFADSPHVSQMCVTAEGRFSSACLSSVHHHPVYSGPGCLPTPLPRGMAWPWVCGPGGLIGRLGDCLVRPLLGFQGGALARPWAKDLL